MARGVALIVSGSKNWTDRELVYERLNLYRLEIAPKKLTLIEGTSKGADQIAGAWADRLDDVGHMPMPAEWSVHADGWCSGSWCAGRDYCIAAGFRRNQAMVDRALWVADEQFVLAFKDHFGKGPTHGTEDLVKRAVAAGITGRRVHHSGC